MSRARTWVAALILPLCALQHGCVRAPSKQPELVSEAEQYQRRGVHAFKKADYVTADSMFRNALRLYESIDNADGTVRANINLVETGIRTRRYEEAGIYLQQAREIAATNRLTGYQSRTALLGSTLALKMAQPERAQSLLEPLLPEFQGDAIIGAPNSVELAAIANRTWIAFDGEPGQAEKWTRRFAAALRTAPGGNPVMEGRLARFQARLAERAGNLDAAQQYLGRALNLYKSVLSQPGIASTLFQSGELYMKQSRWVKAREQFARATAVRIRMLDRQGTAEGLQILAQVETRLGNPDLSASLARSARAIQDGGPVDWSAIRRMIQTH